MIKKNFTGKILSLFIFILFSAAAYADNPKILSYSMVPTNPGFDEPFTVTVEVCLGDNTDNDILIAVHDQNTRKPPSTFGQWFLVSTAGIGVQTLGPASSSGDRFGDNTTMGDGPVYGDTMDCTDCEGGEGQKKTVVYNLVMPSADDFSGCGATSLYLSIVVEKAPLNKDHWVTPTAPACGARMIPFNIPVPPPYLDIHKAAEGVVTKDGDQLVYTINYKYANGGPVTITDPVPLGNHLRFVKAGPALRLTGAPPVGATTGTVTWTLPSKAGAPGYTEGTLWIVYELNGDHDVTPATIGNTVNASMGALTDSSTVSIKTGQATLNLEKSQSSDVLNQGDTITYFLEWEVNGMSVKNYHNFDEFTNGTEYYATAPTGWRHIPEDGYNGRWHIHDDCGTGDNYLQGNRYSPTAAGHYPSLVLDDGSGTDTSDQFCQGMIVSDVIIQDEGYSGADAMIIIRTNGQTGTAARSIGVGISIDTTPGNFFVQKVYPDIPAKVNPPRMGPVYARQWYRVRINVINEATGQRIQAKVWPRGDAEPTGWDINYLDTSMYTADWDCRGTGTYNDWRPGVGNQGGDDIAYPVSDGYDNFAVYVPKSVSDGKVIDDIPVGINSPACTGCLGGTPFTWNLPAGISNDAGSFTWRGIVGTCNNITNVARMESTNNQPIVSNETVLRIGCIEALSVTKTANPNVIKAGETVAFTICWENTGELPSNIVIRDPIPPRTTVINNGGGTVSSGTIRWTVNNSLPGSDGCFTWTGRID